MRAIELIVIHCSATGPEMDIGAEEIRRWHKRRGWSDIGYHWVIRRNGDVETGRAEHRQGAHAKDYNRNSIGVCLIGGVDDNQYPEANYTPAQWHALDAVIEDLLDRYPDALICGHRDLGAPKACPCFDVDQWLDRMTLGDKFYEPI
jgi:N-acetyl-anhydromuramyl-L-alanine amidase AmpD